MKKTLFLVPFFLVSVLSAASSDWGSVYDSSKGWEAPVYAGPVSSTSVFRGYASFWIQNSSGGVYSLPVPLSAEIPIEGSLRMHEIPGYADFSVKEISEAGSGLKAVMKFYYICPPSAETCPADAYYSVEIELKGRVRAFCGAYFNQPDFFPFPVAFCSGYSGSDKIGVTLHRLKYRGPDEH